MALVFQKAYCLRILCIRNGIYAGKLQKPLGGIFLLGSMLVSEWLENHREQWPRGHMPKYTHNIWWPVPHKISSWSIHLDKIVKLESWLCERYRHDLHLKGLWVLQSDTAVCFFKAKRRVSSSALALNLSVFCLWLQDFFPPGFLLIRSGPV